MPRTHVRRRSQGSPGRILQYTSRPWAPRDERTPANLLYCLRHGPAAPCRLVSAPLFTRRALRFREDRHVDRTTGQYCCAGGSSRNA
jgi:hypothetical protein